MIRTALITVVALPALMFGGCSTHESRAKVAGEEMLRVWTPTDPDRPVLSPAVAVLRCDGLPAKIERAVSSTFMCAMAMNSSSATASIKDYCGDAVIETRLAMSPWNDVKAAPQTAEIRACREEVGVLGDQLERADLYQRQVMTFAQDGGEPPPHFLRNPPPSYPAAPAP